jgi:hypothetical protein
MRLKSLQDVEVYYQFNLILELISWAITMSEVLLLSIIRDMYTCNMVEKTTI